VRLLHGIWNFCKNNFLFGKNAGVYKEALWGWNRDFDHLGQNCHWKRRTRIFCQNQDLQDFRIFRIFSALLVGKISLQGDFRFSISSNHHKIVIRIVVPASFV
jgi:hypothetical protein